MRLILVVLVILFMLLMAALSVTPARAQAPFATPTPLPGVQATQQAADAASSAAQAARNEANALEARAAEIRRNADAQGAAAAQAIADARSATAAQNGAAIGEAIGRADSNLAQLQDSVQGQAALIEALRSDNANKDARIGQLKAQVNDTANQLQQAQASQRTTQSAYEALQAYQDEHANDSLVGNAAVLFVFVVVFGLILALVWHTVRGHSNQPESLLPPDITIDRSEAVDGEYTHED